MIKLFQIFTWALLLGAASSGFAQECSSYTEDDFWVPNPILSSDNDFIESAAWNNSIVMLDTGGVSIMSFPSQTSPVITATYPHVCSDVFVHEC